MAAKQRARRTSPLYMPSAFDLFTPSKNIVLKHLNVFGWLYVLPFIFWVHSWIDVPAGSGHWFSRASDANYSWSGFPPSYFAAFIGFSILWFAIVLAGGTIVQIMTQKAQLDASEAKKLSFDRLWATVKEMGWRMLGLYVVVGLTSLVGFVLLIIPGFFMIRRYMMAPYVMLERKCGITEAMARSATLSKLSTGSIWGIMGVILLIGLVGIVPVIGSLASFILGMLYSVAPALRYQQLKKLV